MQVVFSPYTIPEFNLAAEEYFFSANCEEYLFLYVNKPSVIIGSNQAVANEADMDFCSANGIPIVRRLSGGGAVYHDEGNLNYCFIFNREKGISPLSPHFLHPVVFALNFMGIPVKIGKRKDLWLADGHKISGTASHVSRGRELHHGTLLYDVDLEQLQKSLTPPFEITCKKATPSVPSPVKNIRSFCEEASGKTLSTVDFFLSFTKAILGYCNVERLSPLLFEDKTHIDRLSRNKYALREWNFKM
jgi:lipoate-protein ligase A